MGRRRMVVIAVAMTLAALGGWRLAMAQTHAGHGGMATKAHAAAVCEICGKPMVADRAVSLQRAAGGGEHHYRCIHCALVAARDWYQGDLTVRTKSAEGGAPVTLTRAGGKWSVSPSSAVVLMQPEAKGECVDQHVVFANAAEAKYYQRTQRASAHEATFAATDVDKILLAGRGPLPKETTCPVSGQKVHPDAATRWTAYKGKVYYFCCPGCEPKFVTDADGYISGKTPKMKMMEGGSCEGSGQKGHGSTPHQHRPAGQST